MDRVAQGRLAKILIGNGSYLTTFAYLNRTHQHIPDCTLRQCPHTHAAGRPSGCHRSWLMALGFGLSTLMVATP